MITAFPTISTNPLVDSDRVGGGPPDSILLTALRTKDSTGSETRRHRVIPMGKMITT